MCFDVWVTDNQYNVNPLWDLLMIFIKKKLCVCLKKWQGVIYEKGCIAAMEEWVPRNIYTIAGVFIVVSLLQVRIHTYLIFTGTHITLLQEHACKV